MTTKQENKISMYLTTRDFVQGIEAEVNTLPGFTDHFGGFTGAIVELQKHRDTCKRATYRAWQGKSCN